MILKEVFGQKLMLIEGWGVSMKTIGFLMQLGTLIEGNVNVNAT